MQRKKLSIKKITIGELSDFEMKKVVGGDGAAVSRYIGANTKCADTPKITLPSTTVMTNCPPPTPTPGPTCSTLSVVMNSCSAT